MGREVWISLGHWKDSEGMVNMTKNGQYTFWNEEEQMKVWYRGWRWGFAVGIITMFLAAVGIILSFVDPI